MIAALCTLATALIVGGAWSWDHLRQRAEVEAAEIRANNAEQRADVAEDKARAEKERRLGAHDANILLARKRREADEHAFLVAEEFRQHLDAGGCLPTLDAIRATERTGAEVAEIVERVGQRVRGEVVPIRGRKGAGR